MDYNNKLRDRLLEIFLADRDGFFKIDQNRFILAMLDKDWEEMDWKPNKVHVDLIDQLLERGEQIEQISI